MSPEYGGHLQGRRGGRRVRKPRFLWLYSFCYGTRVKRWESHFEGRKAIYFDSWVQTACTGVVSKPTCPSCPSSIPALQTSDVLLKQQPLSCTSLLPNIFKKTVTAYDLFYYLELWAMTLQSLFHEHFRQHCSSGGWRAGWQQHLTSQCLGLILSHTNSFCSSIEVRCILHLCSICSARMLIWCSVPNAVYLSCYEI